MSLRFWRKINLFTNRKNPKLSGVDGTNSQLDDFMENTHD